MNGIGPKTKLKYPELLRRVVVGDQVNEREIELLTNHLKFGATTIGRIYRDRWEIEIFFKVLKQYLKIKTFVGTSPNALKTQIWTALIAVLLLKYLQFRSKCNLALCRLVALLRLNRSHIEISGTGSTTPLKLRLNYPAFNWSLHLRQHMVTRTRKG